MQTLQDLMFLMRRVNPLSKFTTVFVDADETLFDFHKGEQESLKNTLLTLGIEWKPQYSEIYKEENKKVDFSTFIIRSLLRLRQLFGYDID